MLGDGGGYHFADCLIPHHQAGAAVGAVLKPTDIIAGQNALGYRIRMVERPRNLIQRDEMRPFRWRVVRLVFTGDNQAIDHVGIGRKGYFPTGGHGAYHGNIVIPRGKHLPELGPIHSGDGRKRQYQSQNAAGFQFFVGKGGEPGTHSDIAMIASSRFHLPHPVRHSLLILCAGPESRKGGGNLAGRIPFPGSVPGKGRVHNHQVKPTVRHFGGNPTDGFIAVAAHLHGRVNLGGQPGVAHIKQRLHRRGLQQFQRANFDFPIILPAKGHRIETGFLELDGRLDAGQSRAGDMNRPRHYIAAIKDFLHHYWMNRRRVAAGPLVAGGYLVINGRQQGAGAAG